MSMMNVSLETAANETAEKTVRRRRQSNTMQSSALQPRLNKGAAG
jgi:hypothetical protein